MPAACACSVAIATPAPANAFRMFIAAPLVRAPCEAKGTPGYGGEVFQDCIAAAVQKRSCRPRYARDADESPVRRPAEKRRLPAFVSFNAPPTLKPRSAAASCEVADSRKISPPSWRLSEIPYSAVNPVNTESFACGARLNRYPAPP